jgi:hypothetical protein
MSGFDGRAAPRRLLGGSKSMLDLMRRHSQSYLIYGFFAVIIFVFIFFFGPQSQGCEPGRVTTVARVAGHDVSSTQLERLFAARWQSEGGSGRDESMAFVRRRQLLDDILLVRLLADDARDAGIDVSDEQLSRYVLSLENLDRPYYWDARDDQFDQERYEFGVPGSFGMPLEAYEGWKADELLARNYVRLLVDSIVVSPAEVTAVHRLKGTTFNLEYIALTPGAFEGLFEVPDSAVAALLRDDPARVRSYFDEHLDDFSTPRQLRFSRILIRLSGSDDERAEARARFDAALAAVQADPASFADVAREYSSASDAARGGDMGLKAPEDYESFPFIRGRLDELAVGTIETYESETSLIIFTMTEDQPAVVPDLEAVQDQVARAILAGEQSPLAQLGEELLGLAQGGRTLDEVVAAYAAANQVPVDAPADPAVPADDALPGDGAEATPPADTAPPVAQSTEPSPVAAALRVQTTGAFALDRPAFDLSTNPQLAAFDFPAEPEEVPGIGAAPELARSLGTLTTDAPLAPRVFQVGESYYVVRLLEKTEPSGDVPAEEAARITETLRTQRANQIFGRWENRIIGHSPSVELSPFFQEILDRAAEDGRVSVEESYFVFEPDPATVDQTASR